VAGTLALVLELVEGDTLAERIGTGPLLLADALTIAAQIADALDAAHERGIVHRDLKPANIKITPAGAVKVLDFGLAKAVTGDSASGQGLSQRPSMAPGGTRDGMILGTPAYMSPEQARGQTVDKQTDIWAFGCVLYEMLTGRPAFAGATLTDTLAAIVEREPDWIALPKATTAAAHRLLRRCLEKDSKLRLHDIADVRIEIIEALRPNPTDRLTQHGRRAQRLTAAAAVLVIAALGTWAVSRLRRADTGGPVLRLQINQPEGGQFGRFGSGRLPILALSPDGQTVVFGATVDGKYALWLRALDNTAARPMRGTEDATWPFWSPDGRSVAFFASGKLRRFDVASGTTFDVCEVPRVYGGAWAPDGRILVGVLGGTLASVPASGGTLSPLTTLNASMADVAHVWPQVLPGGHFLYWSVSSKPENSGVIYAASFEKPNERIKLVTSETLALYTTDPGGAGYLLWQRGGALVAQEFNGGTLRLSGEPRVIAESIGILGSTAYMAAAASRSGVLVYATAGLQQLTWFDRTGRERGTIGDPGQYSFIRFSSDGRQMATTRLEAGRDLWLIDVDRGVSRRTTHDSRGGLYPQWSPDGRTILFMGEDVTALYRKDATGAALDQRLAPWPAKGSLLTDWSRDGRWILNTQDTVETRADIWVVPVTPDGHLATDAQPKPYLRTPVNESAGRFSPEPNPRWVAYQSDGSGRDEVYVQSFPEPGGPHRISANGGRAPQWGPGGHEIFYQRPDGRVEAVTLNPAADSVNPSAPRELFALPPQSNFEVAPDGKRFLVAKPDPTAHPLTVIINWPALMKEPVTR
jgi:eukaryotic-like serine/threonine-protein kinase